MAFAETHLELTDGWYSIKTVVDDALAALVSQGGLQTGEQRLAQAPIS